jgi:hypothetical protein
MKKQQNTTENNKGFAVLMISTLVLVGLITLSFAYFNGHTGAHPETWLQAKARLLFHGT